MDNFEKIAEVWLEKSEELRTECETYLKGVLEKQEGQRIDWDYDELEELEIEDSVPYVAYDGGNHPEYASTLSSQLYGVYLNTYGEVCVELEESDEYEVDRIATSDLYNITVFIKELLTAREEQE